MRPSNRIPTHPGVVLLREFLEPMNISQTALAQHTGIYVNRINEIVNEKRRVSARTAWLLAAAFGTSPEFWLSLQSSYDLAKHRPTHSVGRIRK